MNQFISKYLPEELKKEKEIINIVEVRTGSDSDFSRIKEGLLNSLNDLKIPYLLTIKSAHRTPGAMIESAKNFPEVLLPSDLEVNTNLSKLEIKVSIAIAGGSAHIAGMTASETSTPIIALPVESSSMGLIDALLSMVNMPPGITNGVAINQESAAKIANNINNLNIEENYNKISLNIPKEYENFIDKDLLKQLGIKIDKGSESPIGIFIQNIDSDEKLDFGNTKVPIIIPITENQINLIGKNRNNKELLDDVNKIRRLSLEGLYMGVNLKKGPRFTNAILYASQILGTTNLSIRNKLKKYSQNLTIDVLNKDSHLLKEQLN